MRRRISLFVGGNLADLDEESLVIMNYTADDVENPTIVRNSFSRQITLPGTGRNAAIFGAAYRLDRKIDRGNTSYVGTGFTPTQKTPFEIYDEMGEILEAGYIRLDKVTRRGGIVDGYTVTLFGSLGAFFYALSYSPGGRKLTLADLPYMNDTEDDLSFTISRNVVSTAWASLRDTGLENLADFINFAPCYNGIPENFDADKALVKPSSVGLPASQTSGGNTYTTPLGSQYAVVNIPQAVDEWAAKDLRSYLQRPVLSIRGLLHGLGNYAAALGWTLDTTDVPYQEAWLTLPMLNQVSVFQDKTVNLANVSPGTDAPTIATITPSPSLSGDTANIDINLWLTFDVNLSWPTLVGQRDAGTGIRPFSVVFVQVIAANSLNVLTGGSKCMVFAPSLLRTWTAQEFATACGFTPDWVTAGDDPFEETPLPDSFSGGGGTFDTDTFNVNFDATNVSTIWVMAYAFDMLEDSAGVIAKVDRLDNGDYSTPTLYDSLGNDALASNAYASVDDWQVSVRENYFRSGATIKKKHILSGEHTPADYLIALAKIYGLSFEVDPKGKKVTVKKRDDHFQNETIDLTDRIDTGKDMDIYPLVVSSKWYDFLFQGSGGAFWDKYLSDYGRTYGLQRVNSGYDFDAGTVDLLDGIALKGAATVLDSSQFWNYITEGGTFKPSPFILNGVTYTLYTSLGVTAEFQVPSPGTGALVNYYNANYAGYDAASGGRLEFRDADGKPQDGRDVLVFWNGHTTLQHFHLSDDLTEMASQNNQRPCWIFDASGGSLSVPDFGRYKVSGETVTDSLDFGVPLELGLPGLTYPDDASLYAQAWKAYISDRFDADTKIMHGWVDFRGIQVGPELLRKFFWYDGSIWVLNKIVNYSLTTWDPVECEFIQVQDTGNYLNGQTL